jgi:uncharacterized membrane protein (DUF2068 family)
MMRFMMIAHDQSRRHHDVGLVVIGILKLVKGAVLLAVGIGTLSLLDKDVMARVSHWAHLLELDLHSRVMQKLLLRLGVVQKRDIELVSGTSFFYAALLLTEGIGLLLEKVWAEYLAFIITVSFIPIEVYGLTRRVSVTRILVVVLNCLVASYLALRLQQRAMAKRRS